MSESKRPKRESFQVTHTRADKSTVTATVSRADNGVWAIELRRFGKGRLTLKPDGSMAGTRDRREAEQLARRLLKDLAGGGAAADAIGPGGATDQMWGRVKDYLTTRVNGGDITEETAHDAERALRRFFKFVVLELGRTNWREVQRGDIREFTNHLFAIVTNRGTQMSKRTVAKTCNYVKGFFAFALDQEWVDASPIHRNKAVPKQKSEYRRDWLEAWEVGLLLEASFRRRSERGRRACHMWPFILAVQAYTGAREREVLGLRTADVQLGEHGKWGCGTIVFVPHSQRDLKNKSSERSMDIWPALAAFLKQYVDEFAPSKGGLFFPKRTPHGESMWSNLASSMEGDLVAAGIHKAITDHSMRHSYISARAAMYEVLEVGGTRTLEKVDIDMIAAEVGHASERMTREVYKHQSKFKDPAFTMLDYAAVLERFRDRAKAGVQSSSASSSAALAAAAADRSASMVEAGV